MGSGKLERRVRRNRRAVRLGDLMALLRADGFVCVQRSTGHWTCVHPASKERCNVAPAHGRGDAHLLVVYVDEALQTLDRHRAWAAEQEAS
jgi:predicted RNA binding protein YcfA (HicA-like mRNA interferase family)